MSDDLITLAHGAGGKASRDLIESLMVKIFDNEELSKLEDQASFKLDDLAQFGSRLALTTDSFVVDPLYFPGGNIGKLAVYGTVNDLAVGGAQPLYLTCSLVIEEGFPIAQLVDLLKEMKLAADFAGVSVVTGDTKVVNRGAVDKLFINTAGVGVIPASVNLSASNARVGDKIIINGSIGDHGAAILDARGELSLNSNIESDCQPLNHLTASILSSNSQVRAMRDATRGGLAMVLNEFASSSQVRIRIDESSLPINAEVRGVCELLGLDPLYFANEGKFLAIVAPETAESTLRLIKASPAGRDAQIVGEVIAGSPRVELKTAFGGSRIIDMPMGDQLPRIC